LNIGGSLRFLNEYIKGTEKENRKREYQDIFEGLEIPGLRIRIRCYTVYYANSFSLFQHLQILRKLCFFTGLELGKLRR
jgi:hypothetical protein